MQYAWGALSHSTKRMEVPMQDRILRPRLFTAEEWSSLLHIEDGGRVAELLASIHASKPSLRPPVRHLRKLTLKALSTLNWQPDDVYIVSAAKAERGFRYLQDALPAGVWDQLNDQFWMSLKQRIRGDLWFDLRVHERKMPLTASAMRLLDAIDQAVWSNLADTDWSTFEEALGEEMWNGVRERIQRSFEGVLAHEIATIAIGSPPDTAGEGSMQLFLDLYLSGNFPVGRVQDRNLRDSFMVLVA